MLNLEPITIEHESLFRRCIDAAGSQNSSVSFGNVYLWSLMCKRNVGLFGERLCVEFLCRQGEPFYAFPLGRGELAPALEAMRERSRSLGRRFLFRCVTAEEKEELEAAFPGCFRFQLNDALSDYLYSAQSLSTLAGKKLHGKRNHCNRFEAAHQWRFQALTPDLFDECREILRCWDENNDGGDEEENAAVECAFRYWDKLDMVGGALFAEERMVAFTFGELLRPDTFDVHFEKALADVEGAYPMVCREFVRLLLDKYPEIEIINREEDMGLPGLRKAKQEWRPLSLLEKYTAEWKEDA